MTSPYISLIIACYQPSNNSILNSIQIGNFNEKIIKDIEVIYLFNGLDKSFEDTRNKISKNLLQYKNCKIISSENNLGVGLGYQTLCEKASGKYIYCLTDDDLISNSNIMNTLDFLKANNDVNIVHQLLDDKNYEESRLFCGIHNMTSKTYNSAFAYICFRYGALPGTIFLRSLFLKKNRNWKDKLYPWIELAFEAYGNKISIFDPIDRIIVDPGAPAHQRFNDRVKRDFDYGFNERFSYSLYAAQDVRSIYAYLTINWISKIIFTIKKTDKNLAKKVSKALIVSNRLNLALIYFLAPFRIGFILNPLSLLGFWKWRKKR
jgi:hypothetical protein